MAQLLLTHPTHTRRSPHSFNTEPFINRYASIMLFMGMTGILCLLGFFYLVKSTEIHTKGYQLRKLEIERSKLISVRQTQRTDIEQLRSLNSIQGSSMVARMVSSKNPVFAKQDGAVAQLPESLQP